MAKGPRKKRVSANTILINEQQFDTLIDKLDLLTKVTAASVFHGEKLKEGIVFLSDLGLPSKEIARTLGTTNGYVRNVKSETKKPSKKEQVPTEEKTQQEKPATTIQ